MEYRNSHSTPAPEVVRKVVELPLTEAEEKGIVIVHCSFAGEGAIRIWKSTFLVDRLSNCKSKLLHTENISMAPQWTLIDSSKTYNFTLYFEGLKKSCKVFDLQEIIPQPGGFFIPAIIRNQEDVYRVQIV